MPDRVAAVTRAAIQGAIDAIDIIGATTAVRQVVVIVQMVDGGGEDDTALMAAGVGDAAEPRPVFNSLLVHAKIAAKKLGGDIQILNIDDIGRG